MKPFLPLAESNKKRWLYKTYKLIKFVPSDQHCALPVKSLQLLLCPHEGDTSNTWVCKNLGCVGTAPAVSVRYKWGETNEGLQCGKHFKRHVRWLWVNVANETGAHKVLELFCVWTFGHSKQRLGHMDRLPTTAETEAGSLPTVWLHLLQACLPQATHSQHRSTAKYQHTLTIAS